jgi:hypothetical protein
MAGDGGRKEEDEDLGINKIEWENGEAIHG